MKVLHFVHNYPPEFRGGVERAVETLVDALGELGVESVVVSGSEQATSAATLRHEVHREVRVMRVIGGRTLRQPADPFRADLAPLIDAVLLAERPDLVHVHHWWNLGSDLVRRAALHGIPAVVTLHDHFASCARFFRLPLGVPCEKPQGVDTCGPCLAPDNPLDDIELTARIARRHPDFLSELKTASVVLAPSDSHARRCEQAFPGISVLTVPLGSVPLKPVPCHQFDGTLRILHAGNLCRIKGVEMLCQSVQSALVSGARVALTLAGPCVESNLSLTGAEQVGPYDHEMLRVLAAQHDIIAIPSLALESYSFAFDEAMRLGLPVLVSDRGALLERVSTRGKALPAGDVAAWSKAIVDLCKQPEQLTTWRANPMPPLMTPLENATTLLRFYKQAEAQSPQRPNLEHGALERLSHLEGRLADILAAMARTQSQNPTHE